VVVPWLHVVRAHPELLKRYTSVYGNKYLIVKRFIKNITRLFFRLALLTGRRFFRGRFNNRSFSNFCSSGKIDVLFVSHLISEQHLEVNRDFYFEDLPNIFIKNGSSVGVALINHTKTSSEFSQRRCKNLHFPRLILPESTGITDELKMLWRMLLLASRLLLDARRTQSKVSTVLRLHAACEALSESALFVLRLQRQVHELVRRFEPKVIFTTFEGHGFERVIFAVARSVNPSIRCVGYQHSGLFETSHSALRRLECMYNPDVILTIGEADKRRLEESYNDEVTAVHVVGTRRSGPLSTSLERAASFLNNGRACLVLPEAFEDEMRFLFDFAIECALGLRQVMFFFRVHPSISVSEFIQKEPKYKDLPSNVAFSTVDFKSDLSRCKWGMYRGSTAAFAALASGLRPVYVHRVTEISFDPLHRLGSWRKVVSEATEMSQLIEDDTSCLPRSVKDEQEAVQLFLQDSFSPMNADVVARLFNIPYEKFDNLRDS